MTESSFHRMSAPPAPADPDMLARNLERWSAAVDRELEGDEREAARRLLDGRNGRLLCACLGNSPFLTDCILKHPGFALACLTQGYDPAIRAALEAARHELAGTAKIETVSRILRVARRQVALGIALADLSGAWAVPAITATLSDFADWAIGSALDALVREAAGRGVFEIDPNRSAPNRNSGLFVIGMGKLGAHELNYSSDIDLIVFFDPEIVPVRRPERLQREMVRLTQGLVELLQKRTSDGYVFRTDLRLRPDPASTPVALSVDAAEVYYESMGQNWERAAMIKARIVAGDMTAGTAFLDRLRPFIWRRNLDFATIQDVHSIKRQINARRGGGSIRSPGGLPGHDVKLGRGGIREIEFFAQTQQLIFGGRDTSLRERSTVRAIDALVAAGRVEPRAAGDLDAAYEFLRTVEHRIQMVEDRQTQTLPESAEEFGAFATFMGYPTADDFLAALFHHLQRVENRYAGLFEEAPALGGPSSLVFTGGHHDPDTLNTLSSLGFSEPETVSSVIRGWHHGRYRATHSDRARQLLTELTPALLQAIGGSPAPDEAFRRLDAFIRSLPAGVPLFSLLHANPKLLDLIAEIMGTAPQLATTLGRRPTLFDALLDRGFFDTLPDRQALADGLADSLPVDCSFEESLDAVRRWCAEARFGIGVRFLRGTISAAQAGNAYADVADAAVSAILPRVQTVFAEKHGRFETGGFCILALGKLGGRELTATSDLDLVFVYDDRIGDARSDGERPLALSLYYARFAQRLFSALTAPTAEGGLFEVDLRLRPFGNKGPLASSFSAFEDYQANHAWTWEQMTITRARVVVGSERLAHDVMAVTARSVNRTRAAGTLAADVADMRRRLAENRAAPTLWHVKNMPGGILDIEFVAQFLILLHGGANPDLRHANTAEALKNLRKAGCLENEDADTLLRAAILWQTIQALLRLTGAARDLTDGPPTSLHPLLCRATKRPDIRVLEADMQELAGAVRAVYDRVVAETAAGGAPAESGPLPSHALKTAEGD